MGLICRYGALVMLMLVALSTVDARESTARATKDQTALDRYVYTVDPAYNYRQEAVLPGEGITIHVLDLTSQSWRSADEVDRTLWKHWMRVYIPAEVKSETALMYIGGGANDKPAPDKGSKEFEIIAKTTNAVVVELGTIPNQPLTFAGETEGRKEDALIAYTWDKFLRTGDENWPARQPMTKSVVRAMDAVQDYCASEDGGAIAIKDFVVAGGSKRGWTTWTTAAVDNRVVAIVPIVIDMLNVVESFKHHWEAYGFWAPAVGDYDAMGLMDWIETPEYEKLLALVEPYSYIDRFTMPKLIMNSSGDQFFLPDSSQFYWDDLVGEKYLRYVPNSDHGLDGTDALFTLLAFFHSIASDTPLPQYSWTYGENQTLTVRSPSKPTSVKFWTATNPKARDFRLEAVGPIWESVPVEDKGDGVYEVTMSVPEAGWTAHMVELTFSGPAGTPLKYTTPIKVLPETCPFKYTPPADKPKGFLTK